MRLEVDPSTNDASLLFRKSARSAWPSPIWLRQWSALPAGNDQIQSLEFRQGADITLDGIVLVSYEEWPNGEWANGIVPENYFRLYTATGPSWDDTDNILEFHSAPKLTEIDVPPASWAQRGMTKPVVSDTDYSVDEADLTKSLKVAVQETTEGMAGSGNPTPTPSNVTFEVNGSGNSSIYLYALTSTFTGLSDTGSSSISNSDFIALIFYPSTYTITSTYTDKYRSFFKGTFLKTKFPVNLEISNTSYALTYLGGDTNQSSFYTLAEIPTGDRVSATDLTKAINFELVESKLWTREVQEVQ